MEDKKIWKKFLIQALTVSISLLIFVAVLVIYVDPMFHFHAPAKGVSYILDNERYQNNGILKNFDYDALVTGTSMSENFKTSSVDALFGTKSVKASYAGGYFKEIYDAERFALANNPDLKMVIRSVDMSFIMTESDYINPAASYPHYLMDDDPFNDDIYVFNADILFEYVNAELIRSAKKIPADTFDDYMNFEEKDDCSGPGYVLLFVEDYEAPLEQKGLEDSEREMLIENIRANLTANPAAYPDTEFYYFIPPYSIADWWQTYVSKGRLDAYIETMTIVTEELLKYDNVHVFCFYDDTDMVTDLYNYTDSCHYVSSVSEMILEKMASGENELTEDDYKEYYESLRKFYSEFDYSSVIPGAVFK